MQVSTKIKLQYLTASFLGRTTKCKHGIHILTYHSISSDPDRLRHTPPELLEEHICFLQQSGYKSFRVCDIASSWPAILTKAPAVIITFDDGLYDNREVAYSILKKYDMTATFFVPTAYIKNERSPSHAVEMGVYDSFRQ